MSRKTASVLGSLLLLLGGSITILAAEKLFQSVLYFLLLTSLMTYGYVLLSGQNVQPQGISQRERHLYVIAIGAIVGGFTLYVINVLLLLNINPLVPLAIHSAGGYLLLKLEDTYHQD